MIQLISGVSSSTYTCKEEWKRPKNYQWFANEGWKGLLRRFRKVKVHTFHRFFRHCSLNIKFELYLVLKIRTRTGDLGGGRYLELNMFHYEELVDFEIFSLKLLMHLMSSIMLMLATHHNFTHQWSFKLF